MFLRGVWMKIFAKRFFFLVFGLFLFSLGIVITLRANIGYAPWEVFHAGFAKATGLSFGMASIVIGVFVAVVVTILGEKPGLGTLFSMTITGLFIDLILWIDVIPLSANLPIGIFMLVAGFFVVSFGTCLYLKSSFGAGPRDNLMIVLNRKTKLPVGVCRGAVELIVTLVGWLLGGMLGVGTVISVLAAGFCIQAVFGIMKFDASSVNHETLAQTYRTLKLLRGVKNETNEKI